MEVLISANFRRRAQNQLFRSQDPELYGIVDHELNPRMLCFCFLKDRYFSKLLKFNCKNQLNKNKLRSKWFYCYPSKNQKAAEDILTVEGLIR